MHKEGVSDAHAHGDKRDPDPRWGGVLRPTGWLGSVGRKGAQTLRGGSDALEGLSPMAGGSKKGSDMPRAQTTGGDRGAQTHGDTRTLTRGEDTVLLRGGGQTHRGAQTHMGGANP